MPDFTFVVCGYKKSVNLANARFTLSIGGETGIRTPGASQHNGFQDRRNRPLCHLSFCLRTCALQKCCKGNAIF